MIVEEIDYLEHFGVKGMKWGVRKKDDSGGQVAGNPESFKARMAQRQTRIKNEKAALFIARAKKTDIRISEIDAQIASLPPGVRSRYKARSLGNARQIEKDLRDSDLKRAEKVQNARLTPAQRKVVLGAAVVGTVLAVGYWNRNGEQIMADRRMKDSKKQFGDVFKKNDLLAKASTPDDVLGKVVKGVNPNYSQPGGKMNCRRSTFAYELRRRGFDVEATTSSVGRGQSESGLVNALIRGDKNLNFPQSLSTMSTTTGDIRARPRPDLDKRKYKAYTEKVERLADLKDALSKQPDGARGEVVFREAAFSHSMAWEIFGGKPHIFDSQKGQMFDPDSFGKIAEKWGDPKDMAITRLDNVDLDLEFLGRWAKNK